MVSLRTVPRVSENFELFVNAQRAASGLHLECQFNTGLFDAATIASRMEELGCLLTAAAENPALPVKSLPLLTDAAHDELRRLGQGPSLTASALKTVPESIAAAPATATALTDEAGSRTYGALNTWADARARELVGLGVEPGDVVGLAMARSRSRTAPPSPPPPRSSRATPRGTRWSSSVRPTTPRAASRPPTPR